MPPSNPSLKKVFNPLIFKNRKFYGFFLNLEIILMIEFVIKIL